jgi:ketosteroid isomerase-like protein
MADRHATDEADIRQLITDLTEAIRAMDIDRLTTIFTDDVVSTIEIGGDVAFARSLNRIRGTLQDGRSTDQWVRWTGGLRRVDGAWCIAHDQVSVPIDERSGEALRDLSP